VRVKVGAHTQHHPYPAVGGTGSGQQCRDERSALGAIDAEGENFLELVHHQQQRHIFGLIVQRLQHSEVQRARIGGQVAMHRGGRTVDPCG